MYVAKVPNRGSPPAVLLRESYREAGKVKNRTLANLSSWPNATYRKLIKLSACRCLSLWPLAGMIAAYDAECWGGC